MTAEWRWHYSVPSLALWVLLGLLVVVPRQNRNRQAWLMVIVPLAVAGIGQLWLLLATESSDFFDVLFQLLTTVAAGWAGVWLLAPWLVAKHRVSRALLAWIIMAVVGVVGYLGYFGLHGSGDDAGMWAVFGTILTATLLVAMTLAGFCCRHSYHTAIFMLWLALWMPLVCLTAIVLFSVVMTVAMGEPEMLMAVLCSGLVVVAVVSLVLYAINVPAMVIARLSPLYRERFHALFCPVAPELAWDAPLPVANPFAVVTAPVANPPQGPGESEGECPFARPEKPQS